MGAGAPGARHVLEGDGGLGGGALARAAQSSRPLCGRAPPGGRKALVWPLHHWRIQFFLFYPKRKLRMPKKRPKMRLAPVESFRHHLTTI
eukprot:646006-Prorocentrum_minimum.AAC.1